jgi:hypothetical protein
VIIVPATTSLTAQESRSIPTRLRSLLPATIAMLMAAVLAPWCVVLALTLPTSTIAAHWSLAWSGLDAAEAVTAGLTAWLIRRRSPSAALTSAMVGTLLLADAWFDVCTSARGLPQLIAVLQAALLEIPLSYAALWFAAVTIRCAAQAGSSAGTATGA